MRFHALLPVRDEADIIGQSLAHVLTWADRVCVFDTGSADETWDIVQDFAHRDPRVDLLRREAVHFHDATVRGWLFDHARAGMEDGDWFLRVDADEFHHIPPQEFVNLHISRHETVVWHQYYNFHLTQSEVAAWQHGEETVRDRSRPIEERRRTFTASLYSEPRLYRYRSSMKWPVTCSAPRNAGYVARKRLPIRHYPHRDPLQMERRCLIRAFMIATGGNQFFTGYSPIDLERYRSFFLDDKDGDKHALAFVDRSTLRDEWNHFVVPDDLPGLLRWNPGTPLPEYQFTNHLASVPVRSAQRILHCSLVRFLDRLRKGWRPSDGPVPIADSVSKALAAALEKHSVDAIQKEKPPSARHDHYNDQT